MPAIDVVGEFETIQRLLKPLAHPEWARGLADDVAALPSRPGFDLILTKDALVEGVHFLPEDPLDEVAQKLLRVNLSDIAAKGAVPFGYLLACHWSERCGWPEREAFVAGLRRDQAMFDIHLIGGDTVRTPGPLSFSVTMLGWVPAGRAVHRGGANAGDAVFVTGTIGDGWLGLQACQGTLKLAQDRLDYLRRVYRTPMPQTDFADIVLRYATASADVSDGLLADAGRLATASGLGVAIDLEVTPRSAAADSWFEGRVDEQAALEQLATGGDDYQILFTAPPALEETLRREADRRHIRLTRVGTMEAGNGLTVRYRGAVIEPAVTGWTHD
ncbi:MULTISPECIES: thiamine-phosphate kinase [unclassified Brevundimonas]|uniref:thiamine-phosphate kinase n=1 Tax=unclassified Brevundimonas TaxID=2622653 RepID=UPI0025B7CBA5|nr:MULTISPECIES: thiamine-phosphate kinase [unclassified Brevundimonas]